MKQRQLFWQQGNLLAQKFIEVYLRTESCIYSILWEDDRSAIRSLIDLIQLAVFAVSKPSIDQNFEILSLILSTVL